MAFLRDIFDISIPGQRINAAKEQRAQRAAAEAERQRQAEAFKAIQGGDVLGAAAQDPGLASQFQGVQQGQDNLDAGRQQRLQQAAVAAVRGARTLAQRSGDPLGALDSIAARAGNLFPEEDLAEVRAVIEQHGVDGFDLIEQSFTEPQRRGTPGKPFAVQDAEGNRVLVDRDPDTGELVQVEGFFPDESAGGGSLDDLRRRDLESRIAAREAKSAADTKKQSPGQKKLDEKFADEAIDFLSGGASVASANIARLDNAVEQLEESDNLTGRLLGLGDVNVRTITNPRSAAVQQQVQNAIQESLKATLGAQFARVEGEQLLDRAFASRQDEAENIRRVNIVAELTRDMVEKKQAMVDYFMENGTLVGYQGERPNVDGFLEVLETFSKESPNDEKTSSSKTSPVPQEALDIGFTQEEWDALTPEEQESF